MNLVELDYALRKLCLSGMADLEARFCRIVLSGYPVFRLGSGGVNVE